MAQLLVEHTSTQSSLVELPSKGHWFDGVMTTPHLSAFYDRMCEAYQHDGCERDAQLGQMKSFSLTVGNPADTGSKFGLEVLYLQNPAGFGKLHVTVAGGVCISL